MPLFARKPRSLADALIALADSLERHAVEIRQLAGGATTTTTPTAVDPLDDVLIDIDQIIADDEASVRRG